MLLSLFLLDLAAGLLLFLPLVGRRNAGVKFYRLMLVIAFVLTALALASHWRWRELALTDAVPLLLTALFWLVLRYPRRLIYRATALLLGLSYLAAAVRAYDAAVRPPHLAWSVAGALASIALLGSVNLAMLLGHWYLVVRGMAIDPLERLTHATLASTIVRVAVVTTALLVAAPPAMRDIFFWMRCGWGLLGPLVLYPMVWGTVRIRSTMAATGILYVDVVAVVIGEVLAGWISAASHLPL